MVTAPCVSPQPRGEQLGPAAPRPAPPSLPAALHPLRAGQGEGGRRVLGVCPPPQQAARPGAARLPGSPAVGRTLTRRGSVLLFVDFQIHPKRLHPLPRKFWPVSFTVAVPAPGEMQQVLFTCSLDFQNETNCF